MFTKCVPLTVRRLQYYSGIACVLVYVRTYVCVSVCLCEMASERVRSCYTVITFTSRHGGAFLKVVRHLGDWKSPQCGPGAKPRSRNIFVTNTLNFEAESKEIWKMKKLIFTVSLPPPQKKEESVYLFCNNSFYRF